MYKAKPRYAYSDNEKIEIIPHTKNGVSFLTIINRGDAVFQGDIHVANLWKKKLSYGKSDWLKINVTVKAKSSTIIQLDDSTNLYGAIEGSRDGAWAELEGKRKISTDAGSIYFLKVSDSEYRVKQNMTGEVSVCLPKGSLSIKIVTNENEEESAEFKKEGNTIKFYYDIDKVGKLGYYIIKKK